MSSSTDPPATTAAPLPAAGKSPALAPIKALAPLTSLPPMHTNTDNETSTPSGETNAEQPQQTFSADDDVGDVARMRNEHLLHQRWTFWYDLKDQGKPNHASWGASLKKLMDLESVEQFFGMVNNVAKPSALPVGSDYHLFKYGVKPEWEGSSFMLAESSTTRTTGRHHHVNEC
jgi:hypothetical protein